MKINFRFCPNSQWLSISSRVIESSSGAQGCVYNVLPFPLCPPLPLLFPPPLCSNYTSLLTVPQTCQVPFGLGPWCLQFPLSGSLTAGDPNSSLLHLFSVYNVTCSVMPSLAPYLTLHLSPSHISCPLSLPFPLFSIYYHKNDCTYLLSSIFSLLEKNSKGQ